LRKMGMGHDGLLRSWHADGRFATIMTDGRRHGALYVVKS
jgi:hypothetical protein